MWNALGPLHAARANGPSSTAAVEAARIGAKAAEWIARKGAHRHAERAAFNATLHPAHRAHCGLDGAANAAALVPGAPTRPLPPSGISGRRRPATQGGSVNGRAERAGEEHGRGLAAKVASFERSSDVVGPSSSRHTAAAAPTAEAPQAVAPQAAGGPTAKPPTLSLLGSDRNTHALSSLGGDLRVDRGSFDFLRTSLDSLDGFSAPKKRATDEVRSAATTVVCRLSSVVSRGPTRLPPSTNAQWPVMDVVAVPQTHQTDGCYVCVCAVRESASESHRSPQPLLR